MKISQMQAQLEEYKEREGDIEVMFSYKDARGYEGHNNPKLIPFNKEDHLAITYIRTNLSDMLRKQNFIYEYEPYINSKNQMGEKVLRIRFNLKRK